MTKTLRNIVIIDENKCNGCGDCVIVCPVRAISEESAGGSLTSAAVIEA